MAVDELEPRILSERIESGKLKKENVKNIVVVKIFLLGMPAKLLTAVSIISVFPKKLNLLKKCSPNTLVMVQNLYE